MGLQRVGHIWATFTSLLKWNQGASQVVLVVRNPPANTGDIRDRCDPWVGKIPWRRAWQPTPVFLSGESPWTEEPDEQLDTTEVTQHTHASGIMGFPGGSVVKNLPAKQVTRVHPWIRKIPWRRKWQPTPVFLPDESHGQRSLASYSPWGHKRVRHDLATKQQEESHSICLSVMKY